MIFWRRGGHVSGAGPRSTCENGWRGRGGRRTRRVMAKAPSLPVFFLPSPPQRGRGETSWALTLLAEGGRPPVGNDPLAVGGRLGRLDGQRAGHQPRAGLVGVDQLAQ